MGQQGSMRLDAFTSANSSTKQYINKQIFVKKGGQKYKVNISEQEVIRTEDVILAFDTISPSASPGDQSNINNVSSNGSLKMMKT